MNGLYLQNVSLAGVAHRANEFRKMTENNNRERNFKRIPFQLSNRGLL